MILSFSKILRWHWGFLYLSHLHKKCNFHFDDCLPNDFFAFDTFWRNLGLKQKFYKNKITCSQKIVVCRYVKKNCAKICPGKKLLAKNALKQANFIVFSPTFQEAITFFRKHSALDFWYVVELVEFYRFVYFETSGV